MTNIEESGKEFAGTLIETIENAGITTQLPNIEEAFQSGVYFGAVQGYKRGINHAFDTLIKYLPDIYNEIVKSNFDMSINWPQKFKELMLEKEFGINITQ